MKLSLTPNPASGSVTLSYDLPGSEPMAIHIFDLKGVEVATKRAVSGDSGQANIDLGGLPAGRYIVRVDCSGRSQATVLLVR
jgi:hypothetical protein